MALASASAAIELLAAGTVIPAHPLALTPDRKLDVSRQRALTRYYVAAGSGGLAVGVHTTQFCIRAARWSLLQPVLELAAETLDTAVHGRPFVRVAGAVGDIAQAVREAELAASLGYHAVLLSPVATAGLSEEMMLVRAREVGAVLPVIGFYLQDAVGGHYLSPSFWRELANQPSVVAIKVAPFSRYRTIDVLRGVSESDRSSEIALYTGNDDSIVFDLLSGYASLPQQPPLRIVGGLLGQWAVWTRNAVRLQDEARRAAAGDDSLLRSLTEKALQLTDANAALFDAANGFRGCIPGINYVLHQQGLLASPWCLEEREVLSPGQREEIERVRRAYPWLLDDEFVAAHLDEWID